VTLVRRYRALASLVRRSFSYRAEFAVEVDERLVIGHCLGALEQDGARE